jgi:signal transduction histidine kinase
LIDAVPTPLMILNGHHQIVYANQGLLDLVSAAEEHQVHGLRPGEVLDCAVAHQSLAGCGTGEACRTCGALLATLSGLVGRKDERECCLNRIREGRLEALDLRVRATPLSCPEGHFTVFAFTDISHEKRRRVLERIFFHDILNVTGSIRGFAEMLQCQQRTDREEIYALIHAAAEQTIEEIETQRILSAAESQELQIRPAPLRLVDLLQTTVGIFRRHEVAEERELALDPQIPDILLVSDRALLGRILGNLIKNALEACAPGETATVRCSVENQRVRFSVHNPGVIPQQVRLQIFKRSFSTKGLGRGLGTYSLKLLCRYLQSEVSFSSNEVEGTTFHVLHPLNLPESPF